MSRPTPLQLALSDGDVEAAPPLCSTVHRPVPMPLLLVGALIEAAVRMHAHGPRALFSACPLAMGPNACSRQQEEGRRGQSARS